MSTNGLYGHPTEPVIDDKGQVVSVKDWLGNLVRVGDPVVYAIGAGRGQQLAIGHVVDIGLEEDLYPRYDHVSIRVITGASSGNWSNTKRATPAWVNAMNVTALAGFEPAVLDRLAAA